MSARQDEERGKGIPFTEEERAARHYEQYGTTDLPPRGTGLGELPAIKVLKSFASPDSIGNIGQMTSAQRAGLIGLVVGGLVGWYVAKRWPNFIVKWVGVIAGANLGVIIAEFMQASTLTQRR